MTSLFRNIRFYILCLTGLTVLVVYIWVGVQFGEGNLATVKLAQTFALLALFYLYLSLLITPLYEAFPKLPFKGRVVKARRAIGFSAWVYAAFHVRYSFFGELGGFSGLSFLTNEYLVAISLSATALLIFTFMAATSFDSMVRRLGSWWKRLHRLTYVASLFIVVHALMLGSHFIDLSSSLVSHISFALLAFLLLLEAGRVDRILAKRYAFKPRFGIGLVLVVLVLSASFHYLLPAGVGGSLNVHSAHIQLAQQNQSTVVSGFSSNVNLNSPAFAGLRGDKTKRYTVSFEHGPLTDSADTMYTFQVFDASSGYSVKSYSQVFGKYMHVIMVNEKLDYFVHLHPEFVQDKFVLIQPSLPGGLYHLYVDYQPFGAIEQQQAFTFQVGSPKQERATQVVDTSKKKVFGRYELELATSAPLKASELSVGNQTISFTLRDAATKKPITNLKPYLQAFGHLVMIKQDGFDYLHVHPNNLTIPVATDNGGPTVTFLPLGLYGPIKPGVYRVFAEFNPDGTLFTADFTIKIE